MPKFIVTHGVLNLGSGKTVAAGQSFEATAAQVEVVPNVLPFVEGELSLSAFVENGLKPSGFHAHLLRLRAPAFTGPAGSTPCIPATGR